MIKYNRIRFSIIIPIVLLATNAFAQSGNTGMRFSEFGGTQATYENPAFGAANKTKWEVQLFNANEIFENNTYKLNWRNFLKDGKFNLSSEAASDFSFRNALEVCGPAVMYNFKNIFSVGVNIRTRFFFQMQDANRNLTKAALTDSNFSLANYGAITEDYLNFNMHLLTDVGLTGSATVFKTEKHSLTLGASLRMYKGQAAMDFTAKNVNIDPDNIIGADSVVRFSANMQVDAAFPDELNPLAGGNQNIDFESIINNAMSKSPGSGMGGDIGAVYQGTLLTRKIRASIAITDIGQITYNKGNQYNALFSANNIAIPIDSFESFPSGYDSIKEWAADYGVIVDTAKHSFVQKLPTRMNLFAEIALTKNIHVGIANSINLSTNDSKASSYSSYMAVIPRFQSRLLEAWAPISYNYFSKNMKAGFGARIGFLYFGTDDLLSALTSEVKGVNFYLGLRVAGLKK